ncbi:hypothetical protein [Moorena sp. SIO4G3]|uniref:hypothetical protein n=1 Tax=Moorena sp. SIO4G3 TaxID=2607821 RepID=UPI00142A78D0|nr:hypothetical protein [Moorena sp. SIO4G3]NEO82189.1 hypothetical protein [Moorena sp. SIO4G3]
MLIIDKEAATQQVEWLDNSTIIFQNQLFTRGFDIFPNAYKKAFKFCLCKISEESQPLYLLLEHPHFFTLWMEQQKGILSNEIFSFPINIVQPKSTDSLSLQAARYKAETLRHLDGEESRNHNQFSTAVLPDSLPEDISASKASVVTENVGYWYNSTESDSPENSKVATGHLNQDQEIPESEFQVHPRCQQITEQCLKRLSKNKYRGIYYQEQDFLIQLRQSEL